MTRYMPSVVRMMRETIADQPDDLDAQFNLACALAELSQFRESIEVLQRLVEVDPGYDDGAALMLLGLSYQRLRWFDDALDTFQKAYEFGATSMATQISIATCLASKGEFSAAEASLQSAILDAKERGDSVTLWGHIAQIRFDAGDIDGSDAAFFRAARRDPKDPEPWMARAKFYLDRSETERALRAIEKARALSRENPDVLVTYADCLLQSGDEQSALALVKESAPVVRSLIRRRPALFWMLEEE